MLSQLEYDTEVHEEKLIEKINQKYHNIVVFFGDDEVQNQGTTKIRRNIFAGTQDREENAMIFLENLSKVKKSSNKDRNAPFSKKLSEFEDLNASFDTNNQTDAEISTLNNKR